MKQNKNLEIIHMKYKKMGVPGLPLGITEVCTVRVFPVAIILMRLQHNATIKEMVRNLYQTSES